MGSFINWALNGAISPGYRICNPTATFQQLLAGSFVNNIIASTIPWAIRKIPPSPLLNRITSLNVPVALLEVSKCVGWVFTANYVYGVALSLLLGRSWLVKAVILGISNGVTSFLMKRAITAVFWSKQGRELDIVKTDWNNFLEQHPIIFLERKSLKWNCDKMQTSFFENVQRVIGCFQERYTASVQSAKNAQEVEDYQGEMSKLKAYEMSLDRFIKWRGIPIPVGEFLTLREIIRERVIDYPKKEGLFEESYLESLSRQYELLSRMEELRGPMEKGAFQLSIENNNNLTLMHVVFSNMEDGAWDSLKEDTKSTLLLMQQLVSRTQSSKWVASITSLYNNAVWNEMMTKVQNLNVDNETWWPHIKEAVNRMIDERDKYLNSLLLKKCSRSFIEGVLEEASSMSDIGRSIMYIWENHLFLMLITRYPAFSSFPILFDAITCLFYEFINPLLAPGLDHVSAKLGKINALEEALEPLETVMKDIREEQTKFDAMISAKRTNPASQ